MTSITIKLRGFLYKLIKWRTIKIGKFQKQMPIPTFLGIVLVLYLGHSLIRLFSYGEWHIFVSKHYGYSIEYPGHWVRLGEYTPGVGNKNLKDLNIEFINGDALLLPTSIKVNIHHRSMLDANLEDVAIWGLEIIDVTGGATLVSNLECTAVGINSYPAFTRIYERNPPSRAKHIYVISGEDAFVLQLITSNKKWGDASKIFDRMLASFQLPESSSQSVGQSCD